MSTRTLEAVSRIGLSGIYSNALTSAGESGNTAKIRFGENDPTQFATGTGAGQAQRMWASMSKQLTPGSDLIDVYDFAALDVGGGAGKDILGGSMALTGIKGIYIQNNGPTAGVLLVGGRGNTTAWNSIFNGDDDAKIVLAPGARFAYEDSSAAGLAVADTDNHILELEATGFPVTYDIVIIGI